MEINEKKNVDPKLGVDRDEDIEWDNGEATYGHKRPDFKRKDEPDEEHLAKAQKDAEHDVNNDLKHTNLSQGEDIGNRNNTNNKGLKGKDL